MTFQQAWFAAVDAKNSVLCAGLDPAVYEMGREGEGLPKGTDKRDWALRYVRAVAPYSAAVKPNINYWKGHGDSEALDEIHALATELGCAWIEDSKLADIGDTNDAGMFYAARGPNDAVTFSPFAGNMGEAAKQGRQRGIGVIPMCLMSNAEYAMEKNKPVAVNREDYRPEDILFQVGGTMYVRQYVQLANEAERHGVAGVVIGAPSPKNHLTEEEVQTASIYLSRDRLVLMPALGKQKGDATIHFKHFDGDRIIANVGRALMFPSGSATWEDVAKHYRDMLNELRGAA